MIQGNLRSFYRPSDNIHIFSLNDSSVATVQAWTEKTLVSLKEQAGPHKHLYDFQAVTDVSIYGLRAAIKLKQHPRANEIYAAVVSIHPLTSDKIDMILKIQPGGSFQLFQTQQAAIAWLNSKVPIVDEVSHFFEKAYRQRQRVGG